ncbi:conserved hypothetical protein [Sporisorium reilianum SRZ2]|uniref:WD40 repeat-like protein n=1 Tax=Sporisorium reilianum (strain SRZ2) TaxID=999809 RepID=E6ZX81_SPORE|nr:conserved hypothetical protein [Sporisorium reilianum SRZ2]
MQATTNASLFQTSYSEALGAYRARKAIHTSGLVTPASTSTLDPAARYGYPIHLHPNFEAAVLNAPDELAVEGSGADGGRYRVLSMRVHDGYIWTSEAGGVVRQVDAESGKTVAVYRGAKAPVPAFDFVVTAAGEQLLITGSWDKALRVYRVVAPSGDKAATHDPVQVVPDAMVDFIKCVHVFTSSGNTYIATAGSDKSIMLWDATPLLSSCFDQPLRCLHQSKAHTRPINALASLIALDGTTRVYSADSMGRVLEHTLSSADRLQLVREIQGFTTAVYDLRVGWAREEVEGDTAAGAGDAFVSEVHEEDDGTRYKRVAELWAASGDKSAAGYRLSPLLQPPSPIPSSRTTSHAPLGTQPPLTHAHARLAHTDFVKTVLPLHLSLPSSTVVTGGSDEHIHVFPSPSSSPSTIEAHWHELTALSLYLRPHTAYTPASTLPAPSTDETWIVSASLDGSVRRFNLDTIASLPAPQLVRPSVGVRAQGRAEQWDQYSLPPASAAKLAGEDTVVGGKGVKMTAEEEAELAELMDSDDE